MSMDDYVNHSGRVRLKDINHSTSLGGGGGSRGGKINFAIRNTAGTFSKVHARLLRVRRSVVIANDNRTRS